MDQTDVGFVGTCRAECLAMDYRLTQRQVGDQSLSGFVPQCGAISCGAKS